jgi:hypothetical protein
MAMEAQDVLDVLEVLAEPVSRPPSKAGGASRRSVPNTATPTSIW